MLLSICRRQSTYINMHKLLKQLNCTEFETKTFLALLTETKGASVVNISKKLKLPRTTLYGHLESLMKKGLVRKTIGDRGSIFYTETITNIQELYEEKINQLKKSQKEIKKIMENKKSIQSYEPKFIIHDKPRAAEMIFRDVLRSKEKQTYWFWPVKEMVESISNNTYEIFMKERIKRGIWLNVLWPDSKKIDFSEHSILGPKEKEKSLRRVKILPKEIDQFMGYGIYGSKVAFLSTKREHYGFIIDSIELSNTLKKQFDYLWKQSKKI